MMAKTRGGTSFAPIKLRIPMRNSSEGIKKPVWYSYTSLELKGEDSTRDINMGDSSIQIVVTVINWVRACY